MSEDASKLSMFTSWSKSMTDSALLKDPGLIRSNASSLVRLILNSRCPSLVGKRFRGDLSTVAPTVLTWLICPYRKHSVNETVQPNRGYPPPFLCNGITN